MQSPCMRPFGVDRKQLEAQARLLDRIQLEAQARLKQHEAKTRLHAGKTGPRQHWTGGTGTSVWGTTVQQD